MPHMYGSVDEQMEVCRREGGHLAALLTVDDVEAVREIAKFGENVTSGRG